MNPKRRTRSAMPALALFLIAWTPGCGELQTAINAAINRPDPNAIKYGECGVVTAKSRFTGMPTHGINCVGGTSGMPWDERPNLFITCLYKTRYSARLKTGQRHRHTGEFIQVRHRFAKNPPAPWEEAAWRWEPKNRAASTPSGPIVASLLNGVAARAPLAFRVGTREAAIHFTEGAFAALGDFLTRCTALPERIPPGK